ncbi:MAG TPA: hypothetical protein VEK56_14455 [Vicinamibacterales bacterium]|nr:hypothetical protein [Vicinamibacterales bacterium]
MRSQDLTCVVVLLGAMTAFNAGCEAHATGSAYAEAEAPVVFVSEPTLVEIDAGIWVVQDYDYPVYFYANEYWVIRGGVWYRSRSYDSGWARVEASVVPSVVVNRKHDLYVHYRGGGRTRGAPGGHGGHGPPDHAAAQHGGPPGLNKEERHEEKREEKREQVEEHRGGGPHDHDQGSPNQGPPNQGPPGRGKKGHR